MSLMIPPQDLALVNPAAPAAYLKLRGWECVKQGELGDRWQFRGERKRNIALPHVELDPDDRSLLLTSALRVLAEVEGRDAGAIWREWKDADSDLVSFRLVAPRLVDGTIPLSAAADIQAGALEAFQAACRAEVEPRAAYQGGKLPSVVKAFLDSAVVAPAERGSVILNIRSKVDESDHAQTAWLPESERPQAGIPFERKAVRRLVSAIKAAKTAVHRDLASTGDRDAFDNEIEAGLSANLCDALGLLAGDSTELGAQVTIGVRWSLFVPSDEPTTTVDVGRQELDALPTVAQSLRNIRPIENKTLTGFVRTLGRDPGDKEGTVRVLTELDGRTATVRLHLSKSDYGVAWAAHGDERQIEFTGTLEKAGKIWEVASPTNVRIADEPTA